MFAEGSKRGLMTEPGKTHRESRIPDAALRHPMQTLRFASANVGSLVGKKVEFVDMLFRRKIDVAGLQEIRYKTKELRL